MKVLVDTSAFYALEDASDAHHARACELRDGLRDPRFRLFTTNLVLAESVTLITYRLGVEQAVRFAGLAYDSERLQILRMTDDLERATLERLGKLGDDSLSMVDASLIEIAARWGFERVFGFDSDFTRHGVRLLLPGDLRRAAGDKGKRGSGAR